MNFEPLEARIAPAIVFNFTDVDGDAVTVSISEGNTGDASGGGGIDLGAVKIAGDLGKLAVGDATLTTAGVASLSAVSLGHFGTDTGAPDLAVTVAGKLGALKIGGSLIDGVLFGANDIGAVKIAGDVMSELAAAGIESATGRIASVTIGGKTSNAPIQSAGDLGPVKIGGFATGDIRSLGGRIAGVTIGGDLIASKIVAGVSTTAPFFGTGVDAKISGASVKDNADLAGRGAISKIASVIVKGSVLGTLDPNDAATFAIVAQHVVAVKVGGTPEPLRSGSATDPFNLRNPLGVTLGTVPTAGSFDSHAFEI